MRVALRDVRRFAIAVLAAVLAVALGTISPEVAAAHEMEFDHAPPAGAPTTSPFTSGFNAGGEDAVWEPIATIPTGNPHSDLDFFTQNGIHYAAVGTLAIGPNRGGQTIIQLTDEEGEVDPVFVSGHPSATCISDPAAALGLQHDVEATPKGDALLNTTNPFADRRDTELLIDATDHVGRCHDQGVAGLISAPRGGLEIIDVTDIENPVEIGMTSHIGESHTVNVDPKRPHIVYSVTSDSVSIDNKGTPDDTSDDQRNNEKADNAQRFNLDGFEIADISSCFPSNMTNLEGLEGDTLRDAKRENCRPEVYRYRYPDLHMALGHTLRGSIYGCHELELYPNDLLTCGGGAALLKFDMSGVFDDNGTPDDYTDDTIKGDPMPCRVRPSSTQGPTSTGAMVTDCVVGGTDDAPQPLNVAEWLQAGSPGSLEEHVEWLGSVYHQGRAAASQFPPPTTSGEDIDFNHEAELTHTGRFLLATDERGGGVLPPGAACDSPDFNENGNGGIHAYPVSGLSMDYPAGATAQERKEKAWEAYAVNTDGEKAIYRAPIRTGAQASICTAHVFQQVEDQTRIFMGWYSQGTQVLDYVELPGNGFEWVERGYFIPEGANQWVSHVFKYDENEDGSFTYYGATGDFHVGGGRNAIDVYKVTLPPPADVCTLADESEVTDRDQARETHRPNVDCVLHYEIARGTTDTTYSPGQDVTREQMASFIVNALEAAGAGDKLPASGGSDRFNDIRDSRHRDSINRLAQAGIIRGTSSTTFSPGRRITREQMATFMVAAARFATGDEYAASRTDHFGDVGSGNPHRQNINAGFEADLFSGTQAPGESPNSGRFSPTTQVKRDQMASFLIRLFKQVIQ
jgi:hypothetical protein